MDQGQTTRPPAAQSQDPAPHSEITGGRTEGSRQSSDATGHDTRSASSTQNLISPPGTRISFPQRPHDSRYPDFLPPPPTRSRDGHDRPPSRPFTNTAPVHTIIDDFVPKVDIVEKEESPASDHDDPTHRTIKARIGPTIQHAQAERAKFARQALTYQRLLNYAIVLQVTLGALTTALAAAIKTAQQAQISTAILGGLATLVAAYLARVRGSGEPESSIEHVKDLDQFLRECEALDLDHGHEDVVAKSDLVREVERLRRRFEGLVGNADGYLIGSAEEQEQKPRSFSFLGFTVTIGATTIPPTDKSAA